jgi:hypothetical protein
MKILTLSAQRTLRLERRGEKSSKKQDVENKRSAFISNCPLDVIPLETGIRKVASPLYPLWSYDHSKVVRLRRGERKERIYLVLPPST